MYEFNKLALSSNRTNNVVVMHKKRIHTHTRNIIKPQDSEQQQQQFSNLVASSSFANAQNDCNFVLFSAQRHLHDNICIRIHGDYCFEQQIIFNIKK